MMKNYHVLLPRFVFYILSLKNKFTIVTFASLSLMSNVFCQSKLVDSKEGFLVTVLTDQEKYSIKEVKYYAKDNVGNKVILVDNATATQIDNQYFYLDEKNRLWDINISKSTIAWCNDALTYTFPNKIYDTEKGNKILKRRPKLLMNCFNGIRFVFEPNFGPLLRQGDNRITLNSFATIPKIGLETNLFSSWVGAQVVFFYPGSIEFDEQSPVREFILDNQNDVVRVDVDAGYALGLTFFDGVLVLGWGKLNFDRRDFIPGVPKNALRDEFFFFNIQAITSVRKAINAINSH